MTYETFVGWWDELICALLTPLAVPVYNPDDVSGSSSMVSQDDRGTAVAKVLGVPYEEKAGKSWFYQKAVQFS